MHYTQRLKELRLSKNLKQYDIAKILNITRQQYTLYETGRRQITLDKLMLYKGCYSCIALAVFSFIASSLIMIQID